MLGRARRTDSANSAGDATLFAPPTPAARAHRRDVAGYHPALRSRQVPPGTSMEYPGNLFVVAAPSGAGKSSLVKALLELDSHLAVSVSHTTRPPRGQEVDGREYRFIDEPRFRAMVAEGAFFEWAEVHGNLYGTSRGAIEQSIAEGHDIVLEIDWQGALQIKKLFPQAVLIFILPPSWQELQQRLQRRGEDRPEVIERRMANARIEVAQARHFDFVIVNALFETALFDLKTVVHSQRLKYAALRRNRAAVFTALGLN
jgi:guanylate kinase